MAADGSLLLSREGAPKPEDCGAVRDRDDLDQQGFGGQIFGPLSGSAQASKESSPRPAEGAPPACPNSNAIQTARLKQNRTVAREIDHAPPHRLRRNRSRWRNFGGVRDGLLPSRLRSLGGPPRRQPPGRNRLANGPGAGSSRSSRVDPLPSGCETRASLTIDGNREEPEELVPGGSRWPSAAKAIRPVQALDPAQGRILQAFGRTRRAAPRKRLPRKR